MAIVSQAEYARRRGVTPQAVDKAAKNSRISLVDGMVDTDQADADWRQHTAPRPPVAGMVAAADGDDYDYQAERARREHYEANLAEMRAQQMAGSLVDADAVRRANIRVATEIRTALDRIPDLLALRLAAEPDADKCRKLLRDMVDTVVDQLAMTFTNAG